MNNNINNTLNFVNTIHHNIPSEQIIGTFIRNSTSIKNIFTYIVEQFKKMLKKKAYIHYFTEFMEETELNLAATNLLDLIAEYNMIEKEMNKNV